MEGIASVRTLYADKTFYPFVDGSAKRAAAEHQLCIECIGDAPSEYKLVQKAPTYMYIWPVDRSERPTALLRVSKL
jgi:hypothetical protein